MTVNAIQLRDDILDAIEGATGNVPVAVAEAIWGGVSQAIADNVNGVSGSRFRKYSALAITGVNSGAYINITKNVGGDGIVETTSASTAGQLPLVLEAGERILSVRALVQGTASNRIAIELHRTSPTGGAATQIGSTANNVGTTVQTLTIGGLTEDVDDLMSSYFVRFSFNTTVGQKVWAVVVETTLSP